MVLLFGDVSERSKFEVGTNVLAGCTNRSVDELSRRPAGFLSPFGAETENFRSTRLTVSYLFRRPFLVARLPQISGTMRVMGGSAWFWLTIIVTTSGCLLLSYFGIAWSALFSTTKDVVGQEISSAQRRR